VSETPAVAGDVVVEPVGDARIAAGREAEADIDRREDHPIYLFRRQPVSLDRVEGSADDRGLHGEVPAQAASWNGSQTLTLKPASSRPTLATHRPLRQPWASQEKPRAARYPHASARVG
jgi:hypothetical protein